MDDGGPTASIVLFACLLFTDVFFFGFGSAIHCLNIKEVNRKAEEEMDKKSIRLLSIIGNPDRYVNTVQLIVTLINIIMGGFFLENWLKPIRRFLSYQAQHQLGALISLDIGTIGVVSLVVTTAVLLYILLTFGVLIPKQLAARYADQWAYFCINPAYCVIRLLSPLTGLVSVTSKGLLCLAGIRQDEDANDVTEEEIISMVNEGHEQGVIQASEAEMITNIFEFGDKEAREIMTHRNNIAAIDGRLPLKDAVSLMLDGNNSRYPVYEENIDHIIGILHFKDAMRIHDQDEQMNLPVSQVENLLREPVFIPETRNIDGLFRMMQSTKTQMVIVIDEYGQTMGLVAMEDILEEIVGNLMDEYDEDEEYIEETGNADEYLIEGKTPLEELEERLGISFEEEEFETLNGFLISKMDKIPEENEQFDIDVEGYNFKIIAVRNKMIQSVLVTKLPQSSAIGEETEASGN